MEYILNKYRENKEIINYLIVGVMTTIVSLGTYYFSVLFILDPENAIQLQIANIISWIAAVLFAYFTNRIFVFESKDKNKIREASKFVLARVGTLLMDMFIMFITVTLLKMNDRIAKLLVQVIVTIANYIISKLFVFKSSKK